MLFSCICDTLKLYTYGLQDAWEERKVNESNKKLMEHLNIGEFNRGQSSKLIRNLVEEDKAAFIQKNGKPIAVMISYERYQRMFAKGIDISEY